MADLITNIYNALNPFEPLKPDDPAYVDCQDVRGDADVCRDLGREIIRSDRNTCQLYAGHRGAGKSTELLRLKAYLEANGCRVVYFAAIGDEGSVDPEDAEYTDILLACTRYLLEDLKDADPRPLVGWLEERWKVLKDIGQTEVEFDKLDVQGKLLQFAQLSTSIRAIPTQRQKIRKLLNPHTVTLLEALNQFIQDAKQKLPKGSDRLVMIADNLDRIVTIRDDDGRSNLDEIYLDRGDQLRGLACHLVYTVPISLVYSSRASSLADNYGSPAMLPMIMVRTPDGELHESGYRSLVSILEKRVHRFAPEAKLESEIFSSEAVLQHLCLASGGHARQLLHLAKYAINYTDSLPIAEQAVQRAISILRDDYRRTVQEGEWDGSIPLSTK